MTQHALQDRESRQRGLDMVIRKRWPLWWLATGWAFVLIGGAFAHLWARENREVAEVLLTLYGYATGAWFTWKVAGWADDEVRRRTDEDLFSGHGSES